jgi:hypothetical protein
MGQTKQQVSEGEFNVFSKDFVDYKNKLYMVSDKIN